MKQFYTLLFAIVTAVTFAQIPSNYYDSANGLSGFSLKTELRNITTNGHTARTYDQLYDGDGISGSGGYVDTHSDVAVSSGNNYENDGTVLDMYSENPSAIDDYNYNHGSMQCGNQSSEGDCYNREHLVPQSAFGSAFPMQSDIHHVIPTDGRVNNFRGNLPFGEANDDDWESLNGSLRGSSAMVGYSGSVFEPIDEFKGDIARALLYFATRYQNTVDGYTAFDMFNGTEDQVFYGWAIDVLLDWHNNVDPVDQRERDRNNAAYNFQGNANPFVDHPEYANMIWNPTSDTENPTDPTSLVASNPTDNSIDLTWNASTDNIGVIGYDVYVDGNFNTTIANTSYTVSGFTANTNYCFTVKAKDAAGNESGFSNQDCEMTTNNGSSGGSDELFFSEYIEGSSNNKVLEIANFSGSTVSLSNYTMKLSSNGNANWTATYSFPGGAQILDGDVYVIANGSSILCNSEEDDENNSITAYNGNDAIGLFKNDVLIDILGTLGDNSVYAENVTLIRKPIVNGPNTVYTASEWSSFPQDNCDDLGEHTITLSVNDVSTNNFKFYPNPVSSNKLKFVFNQSISIQIFDILGKQIISKTIQPNNNWLDVSSLNKGIYLVKMTANKQTSIKKLIRN
ncbi:MAG: endonuclease I [Bacteroidetes bacterium]|nr:MAG: endonuclease I [Bacteroidota bacterium]